MRWFLERIAETRGPVEFGYDAGKKDDFDKLLSLGILEHTSNMSEVECNLCNEDDSPQVREDGGKLSYICNYGEGRQDLKSDELAIYRYQDQALYDTIISELGIKQEKAKVTDEGYYEKLMHLGYIKAGKQKAQVVLLPSDKDSELSLYINEMPLGPVVFLTPLHKPDVLRTPSTAYFVPLESLLTKGEGLFSKHIFTESLAGIRRIQFDKQTGNLYLDGDLACALGLNNPHYFFMLSLWDHWQVPQTHADIYAIVKSELKREVEDTASKFCQKMKSEIKGKCTARHRKTIDQIVIKPSTGLYMLTDPGGIQEK